MGIQLFHWNVDKFQNVKILSLLRFSKEESIFRDKSVCVCVCVCVCVRAQVHARLRRRV